jgi:SAM-dependent methyltransferase
MTKDAEIRYVANMATVLNVPYAEVEHHLTSKPFSDPSRWTYLLDMGQILRLLPPPPARILDLGVGSGWTSEMFAWSGYSVLGLDIAPDMISLSRRRLDEALDLHFEVCDYEAPFSFGEFDAVVIYDALHHAEDERAIMANAFRSLKTGGVFISIEPGVGHAISEPTRDVVAKFGTTEKDMPYAHQAKLLSAVGFSTVRQYLRLSQLPLETVSTEMGESQQWAHFRALTEGTTRDGLTSVVVAVKDGTGGTGTECTSPARST